MYDSSNSDLKSAISDPSADHFTTFNNNNITSDDGDVNFDVDDESFCYHTSINSSCDDIYSICSCCNDDIGSVDNYDQIGGSKPNKKLIETSQVEIVACFHLPILKYLTYY